MADSRVDLLRREGLTFKLSLVNFAGRKSPAAASVGGAIRGASVRLVFVDKAMARPMALLRGWAGCGRRLIGKAPHGSGDR